MPSFCGGRRVRRLRTISLFFRAKEGVFGTTRPAIASSLKAFVEFNSDASGLGADAFEVLGDSSPGTEVQLLSNIRGLLAVEVISDEDLGFLTGKLFGDKDEELPQLFRGDASPVASRRVFLLLGSDKRVGWVKTRGVFEFFSPFVVVWNSHHLGANQNNATGRT